MLVSAANRRTVGQGATGEGGDAVQATYPVRHSLREFHCIATAPCFFSLRIVDDDIDAGEEEELELLNVRDFVSRRDGAARSRYLDTTQDSGEGSCLAAAV